MEYNEPNDEERRINEPTPIYGPLAGKKARIFSSFQEQEQEMIEYWASITPLQRLAHLYEMIKISFRITEDEARHIQPSKKVRILKYEA